MSLTAWLLVAAALVYLVGRRRSRQYLAIGAQLLGAAAVASVVGQVLWAILQQ